MLDKPGPQPTPEIGNKETWLKELELPSTRDFLMANILKMKVSHADAEELTQQVILKAMLAVRTDKFRGDSKLKTWLHRIATNEAIDLLQQRQRRPETDSFSNGFDLPSKEPTSEEKYISAEAAKNLRSHFNKLPPKMREVMELLADGLNLTEIAERLNATYMTISGRYFHARKLLKEQMQNEDKK